MSRIIYPINNKLYTAEDVEIINSPRTSGVYSVLDFDLSLSGNVLTVGKGLAWIKNADFKGKAVAFTEPETITLDSADSTLDRYDVVAARYDATKKEPELVVVKGTASENPVMPKRNTESYLYELFLYSILRKAGESTASFENVTDLRENKNYCGIMEDSVTSAVAPVYETLFEYKSGENNTLKVGDTVDFDYSKYQFFIATIDGVFSENDIVLTPTEDKTGQGKFTCLIGSNVISTLTESSQSTFYLRAQIRINELSVTTGHTIQIVQRSNTADFNLENIDNSYITKLVGVTKQPKGYVAVDDVYNPKSHNAQSGQAVAEAVKETIVFSQKFINEKAARFDEKIAQNQTQINQNAKDISELQENYDTLNNGGLILKEDFIGEQVNSWLDEHPEATTTVQDGSLTSPKMSDEMKKWIRTNIINVNDVGIVADDGKDCTEKINGVFEGLKGGEIVYFPSGTYIVSQEHGIKINTSSLAKYTAIGVFNKNDIKIVLGPGAKIKCSLVTGTTQVGIFYFDNCNNIEITGGSIIGELSEHGSVVVNSGINGIEMKGCTNVYVHDVDISNCLGDGVRISPMNGKRCENVTLYNCVIHDCDRNGVSYDGVKNGVIRNCHIYNVTGHSPLAGIDLESEWKTDSNDLVNQDTIIDGCHIHDCGYAVTHSKHSYNTIISNCNFETLTITQSETSIGDLKVINSKFRKIFYFYKCIVENCDMTFITSYSAEIGSAKGYFKNCNIQGTDDTSDGAFLNICSYGDEICFDGCTFRKENPNFTSTNRNIKKGFYSHSSKSGADTQHPFKIKLNNCVEYRWNYTKGFEGIVYNDTLELINCKFIFMNDVKIRPLVADKMSNFKMINCIIDYENAIGGILDYVSTSGFIRINQNDEDSTHTIIGNTILNRADTENEYIQKFVTLTDDSKGNVILCNNIGVNLKKIYEGSVTETGSLKTYGNVDSTTITA